MDIWYIWLIAAVVLIVVEIMSQAMWALCLGVGALGGMICSLAGGSPLLQVTLFGVVTLAAYIGFLPWFRRFHARRDRREARTGMDALPGRRATVTHEIRPGEMGRVRIDGDSWQAVAPGCHAEIRRGETVIVTGYDSIILSVEPAETR